MKKEIKQQPQKPETKETWRLSNLDSSKCVILSSYNDGEKSGKRG